MNKISAAAPAARESGLRAVKISGRDRVSFLQGQLTQDVAAVTPEQPLLGGWNTAKGRLLALAWLVDWQDALWLLVPAELADGIARRLGMFVLRSAVTVESTTATVGYSPADNSTASDNLHLTYSDSSDYSYQFSPYHGAGATLILTLAAQALEPDSGALAFRRANLLAGIPSVFAGTQEHFVPQMLNLDLIGAISFSKGCYVGQEIVARTQNLGRIKRRMYGFTAAGAAAPEPGAAVYGDGKAVGEVVDAVAHPDGVQLLAVMRIEALQDSTVVALQPDGGQPLARRDLPYAVPEAVAAAR